MESFFAVVNLGRGPTTSALLSPVLAPPPLEPPVGAVFCSGIVSVHFDESARVEGTVDPTPASFLDAVVRGTLPTELKKPNSLRKATRYNYEKHSIAT